MMNIGLHVVFVLHYIGKKGSDYPILSSFTSTNELEELGSNPSLCVLSSRFYSNRFNIKKISSNIRGTDCLLTYWVFFSLVFGLFLLIATSGFSIIGNRLDCLDLVE